MMQNFFFNMSSNLKRTKFYFLTIAILSLVIILVCYNWNISENIYSIPSEISQVRISQIKLPDIRLGDKILDGGSRIPSTNFVTNESTKMNSDTDKKRGTENDSFKLNSVTIGHETIDTMNGKENIKKMVGKVKKIQKESNISLVGIERTVFNVDDGNAKFTSQTINADKKINYVEKVSQNINKTTNLINNAKQSNHKMISKGFVKKTTPNRTVGDFEKFKSSKEETRQVLDEIHKLKNEISGSNKIPTVSKRTKSRNKTPRYHVINNNNNNSQLSTERDIRTFRRIKNQLKSLGLVNSAFLMPRDSNFGSDVTSRPDACAGCFEGKFRNIINEPNLCNGDVDLLFMVASTFSRRDSRNAIRNTWCGHCNKPDSKMKLVFLFGNRNDSVDNQNLLDESKDFHDIIQMDFHDTYANLTYKTMSSLQWSEDFCKQAKYVMKTDDDMYINTELLPLVLEAAPNEKFLGGMCWGPSSPHRDSKSKWYVSFVQYRHSLFPSMCSGTGYVMSHDVVSGVLRQSPNVPFFYLEDVYVAICVKQLGVYPVLLDGFKNTRVEFEPCTYRNHVITTHELSAEILDYVWNESRTCPKADLTPEMVYKPIPV